MIDTVVIGAGVSGLRAASRLHEAGRDVVVLEARDRAGGRLASVEVGDARFDLGATWFWANETRIISLIEEEGTEVFAQHLAGDALLQTSDGVTRADGNPIDVPSGRFVDGATAITDALAARLPDGAIEFGQAVRSVRAGVDGVVVETSTMSYTATSVVLAIPPALAVHLIDFEPALPERTETLARMTPVWMGGMRKVVAVYDMPFWRDDGLAGSAMSYVGPLREVHDMSAVTGSPAALFGFSPADPGGTELSPDDVLVQLVDLFGLEAGRPRQLTVTDWSLERFTSPPGAATMQGYQTYGHPLFAEAVFDGAVVWAATETSAVNPGHIDGALAAGDRAAENLLGHPTAHGRATARGTSST